MNPDRKRRLVELGADALADALLELAERDDTADDRVERMVATPKENVRRFKSKLAALRGRRGFISYRQSSAYARQLEALLADLKSGVDDPRTGVELVAAFYEADESVLDACDDSGGSVGDVFRLDARDLFVSYASRCEDKEWLGKLVLRLNQEDQYGVRDVLIDSAIQYLPEPVLRTMIEQLQKSAEQETEEFRKLRRLLGVESLARQLKDAPLFERTRIAAWGKLNAAACVDIAQVYLESGDPQTALEWLEKIPEEDSFRSYERDRLLAAVYTKLGRRDKQEEVAWKIFRSGRSADSLEELLAVIGEAQRQRVITGEAKRILEDENLSYVDAGFLIEMGRMDEAEAYIRSRRDQLEGDFYGSLLPLAEAMDKDKRTLAATLVYRALLDSILARARSKIYGHGVRYLKKLDKLAAAVTDWEDITPHTPYLAELRKVHGRKHAFWSRYEK